MEGLVSRQWVGDVRAGDGDEKWRGDKKESPWRLWELFAEIHSLRAQ
jgi:hypothetical protein